MANQILRDSKGRFTKGTAPSKLFKEGFKYWLGKKRSVETNKKISLKLKGRKLSKEHAAKTIRNLTSFGDQNGNKNPMWKGGKHLSEKGYVVLSTGNGKVKFEHRVVVEKAIGRPLEKSEVIHHINGNRQDNRIENLKVLLKEDHDKLHLNRRIYGSI